tara:strand:+ start:4115 stop:4486 length:372 start_codon:yes stop_codon:yes gene_type:complete
MAIGDINRRVRGSRMIYENRDELAAELLSLGTSSIDDIVEFSSEGVRLRDRSEISDVSMRAVRRIRVTPGRFGSTVDVEMIDKRQILQMLAKSAGLLDQEKEVDKPSVVSIDMVMPDKGVDDG